MHRAVRRRLSAAGWHSKGYLGGFFSKTDFDNNNSGYFAVPQSYEGAEYTYLKGTTANATHWQVTARCQGCTRWSSVDGDFNLENESEAVLAYACSSVAPDEPASNTSTFNIHEQFGIWNHDLKFAKNASFANWTKNNPFEENEKSEGVEKTSYA